MMETTADRGWLFSRGSLVAGGCVLFAFVGLLLPSRKPAPPPVFVARPPVQTAPVERATSTTYWAPGAEPRVNFARTMPRTHGTQVFNNSGTPNPDMVMVAIPAGPKIVRFVRGTDPAAVRYIAETKQAQNQLVVDNGPQDVDTSENADYGPLKGRTTRRIRNSAPDQK